MDGRVEFQNLKSRGEIWTQASGLQGKCANHLTTKAHSEEVKIYDHRLMCKAIDLNKNMSTAILIIQTNV